MYIKYFVLANICFIAEKYVRDEGCVIGFRLSDDYYFVFNASFFFLMLIFHTIAYYVVNFLEIQRLNDDIFDKLNT
jgi:hypothetical protein